jgi:prepilin-type N-terminal cleavage/methylation domain-containing protein
LSSYIACVLYGLHWYLQNEQRGKAMKDKGFTLIEFHVVIAIIAVLMAILIPALQALNKARKQGKRAVRLGNLNAIRPGIGPTYIYLMIVSPY